MRITRKSTVAGTIFLATLLLAGSSTAADNSLRMLERVHIVIEDPPKPALDMGLNAESLESLAIVSLKRDVPRLKIDKASQSFVQIALTAIDLRNGDVVYVKVALYRPVSVLADGSNADLAFTLADLWHGGSLLTGPRQGMAAQIREEIQQQLTQLAAEYYKANPN